MIEEGRRLLVFLHLHFNGNVNEILKELLEKNNCFSKKQVDEKLEEVDLNSYITLLDEDYPEEWKDGCVGLHPFVIEKN